MKIEIPSLTDELRTIYRQEFSNDPHIELIEKLEDELGRLGPFALGNTLNDVMSKGDVLTRSWKTREQTNHYLINKEQFQEKLINSGNELQTIEYTIKDIEDKYSHSTIENIIQDNGNFTIISKPVIKWDMETIGFYCNQQNPEITLRDILYFLLVYEYGDKKVVDNFTIKLALRECSKGVADSLHLKDLYKLKGQFNSSTVVTSTNEVQEDYDIDVRFKSETQKIAWLHKLGITELILSQTMKNGSNNYTKAAAVIHSFTGIESETIRKCLMGIYVGGVYKKNDPFASDSNRMHVENFIAQFGISK